MSENLFGCNGSEWCSKNIFSLCFEAQSYVHSLHWVWAFEAVKNADPYPVPVVKHECITHVTKCMGTRLKQLKKDSKTLKLRDRKGLGGNNRQSHGQFAVLLRQSYPIQTICHP